MITTINEFNKFLNNKFKKYDLVRSTDKKHGGYRINTNIGESITFLAIVDSINGNNVNCHVLLSSGKPVDYPFTTSVWPSGTPIEVNPDEIIEADGKLKNEYSDLIELLKESNDWEISIKKYMILKRPDGLGTGIVK